jgi:serine phosphatase RsbU (regulator of sigma subunit)
LAQCSRLISSDGGPGQGLTLLHAVLDPTVGRVDLASAGNGLAFLASRGEVVDLTPSGAALGFGLEDDYAPLTVLMEPGDALILCSRAVAEALSPIGQEFGTERIREILRQNPNVDEDLPARFAAGVAEFTGRGRSGPELMLVTLVRRRDPA